MSTVAECIKTRRSVRTYDGKPLEEGTKEKLASLMKGIQNPYGLSVEFRFLDAKENGLVCPVVSGTDLYVGGKIKNAANASVAFGYTFESFVLAAEALGLGTVWLGGTMNRPAFEQAMELEEDEIMPCASPVGYPAKKMSVREAMMRKAIKADERLPFEELFFDGTFAVPLSKEKAAKLALPLEMVRLAPSAVNKQPWRAVLADHTVHFYLKRSKGFSYDGKLDMQKIDIGIALCHFELSAKEQGLNSEFLLQDPMLPSADAEYIASYRIIG